MTKEELRNYLSLGKEINLLRLEIERLRASLHAIQQISDMPKGGTGEHDRMASTVARIVDTETSLDDKINEYLIIRGKIEDGISVLPADLRLLIRLRYIEGNRWEKIAVEMNYSWQHLHRMHAHALRKMRVNEST